MTVEDPGKRVDRLKEEERTQAPWTFVEPDAAADPERSAAAAPAKSEATVPQRRRSQQRPSLFVPLAAIAVGAYLLLENLGVALPAPNWNAVLRLWPLLLIFGGLNMIVRQAPRPLGGLLNVATSIAFVSVLAYVLLFAERLPFAALGAGETVQVEDVAYAPDVTEADVAIHPGAPGAVITAGAAGSPLLAGQVSYAGDLLLDTEERGDRATVRLDTRQRWPFGGLASWDAKPWTLALAPEVLLDLELDAGSGMVNADLSGLTLETLVVDGGSGSVALVLPAGTYPASLDFGSGAAVVTFAAGSDLNVRIDSGSGSVALRIPAGTAAQITVDGGSGAFSPDSRFKLVDGDRDDGVWQTAGYDSAAARLEMTLDVGSGAVGVTTP